MYDLLAATSCDLLDLARPFRSPATVLTNVVIAVQCGLQARRVAAHAVGTDREPEMWCAVFACVGVSAALGAVKHGAPHLLDPTLLFAIAGLSNLALGTGIALLQHVMVPGRPAGRAAWGLLYILAAGVSASRGSFALTGLAAAIGLVPVVVAGFRDAVRCRSGGAEFAYAWAAAATAGVAWVAGPAPADWFGRVDVAHVMLMVALGLLLLGAERRVGQTP